MTRPIARTLVSGLVVCAASLQCAQATEVPVAPPATDGSTGIEYHQSLLVDPMDFFTVLVERYRGLVAYADQVRLIQTIEKAGDTPFQTDRQLICQIDPDGRLRVRTAASEVRRSLGLGAAMRRDEAAEQLQRRYDLWLMPHMVLKYADQPLREFREGINEGFTATEATEVTVGEKPMVQVTLRSGDEQQPAAAEFELFVNPDSMLIERIVGAQRLPNGASLETTMEITPTLETATEQTPPAATPAPRSPLAAPNLRRGTM